MCQTTDKHGPSRSSLCATNSKCVERRTPLWHGMRCPSTVPRCTLPPCPTSSHGLAAVDVQSKVARVSHRKRRRRLTERLDTGQSTPFHAIFRHHLFAAHRRGRVPGGRRTTDRREFFIWGARDFGWLASTLCYLSSPALPYSDRERERERECDLLSSPRPKFAHIFISHASRICIYRYIVLV